MSTEYRFEPGRPVAQIAEPILHQLVLHHHHRYASLSEYASASGLDTVTIAGAFGPLIDAGLVTFELVNDEVFVLPAPTGRPLPRHLPDIAPNLWERLRRSAEPEAAFALWCVLRDLEASGWETESSPQRVLAGLGPLRGFAPAQIGVWVGHHAVPVLPHPDQAALIGPPSVLEAYEQAGAPAVAVVCDCTALDDMVTAVRRWALTRPARPGLAVLILEAPRFDPVLVTAADPAVPHHSVDRATLASWNLR